MERERIDEHIEKHLRRVTLRADLSGAIMGRIAMRAERRERRFYHAETLLSLITMAVCVVSIPILDRLLNLFGVLSIALNLGVVKVICHFFFILLVVAAGGAAFLSLKWRREVSGTSSLGGVR